MFSHWGKLAQDIIPLEWDDVVQYELVHVQEGKLACTTFPQGGMMLSEMSSCLCKREI
jgi:hypothetical protein